MTSKNTGNWLNSINRQVGFYQQSNQKYRTDPDFFWEWVDGKSVSIVRTFRDIAKKGFHLLGISTPGQKKSLDWLDNNAEALWESRSLLNDDLSKLLFDSAIILRLSGHRKYFFPRINFDDLLEILGEKPFQDPEFPGDYLGSPLKLFEIRLIDHPNVSPMKMVSFNENILLINNYRQYLISRNSIDISPASGDVVLDCGACIGDTSLLFAGLVGPKGEVHLFDPIPLHTRFCRLQSSLNPSLTHIFHINELAVSSNSQVDQGR